MKASTILKIISVMVLLFIGNRFFNHVTAWGGIGIVALAIALAVYFIAKPIKKSINNNEKD